MVLITLTAWTKNNFMRLDAYLANQFTDLSRSQLQQYIKSGYVTVNGEIANRPSSNVDGDDEVVFNRPQNSDFSTEIATFRSKCIIYEDDNVVVINKPAGMLVHAKGGIAPEFTVADFVRDCFDKTELAKQSNNNRLGIVHRLDRATSGVMICAKNLHTASMLSRQFAERKAHKVYLAVVSRAPRDTKARIDLPIARNLNRPSTFKVDGKGKSAITDYVVRRINGDGTALIELHPMTGRTHQLRVHLAYIGCPIVGDPIYGLSKFSDRLMLHAWQLEITIPGISGGQRRTFVADPPQEFHADD